MPLNSYFVRICTVFLIVFLIGCSGIKTKQQRGKDTDSKDDRICNGGQCVNPSSAQVSPKNRDHTEKLEGQFKQSYQGLTATDWFKKAVAFWDGEKYTAPKKAIEYLNNAIRLQPGYADAYYSRGFAYDNLGQYQSSIKDYNNAIRLKPDDAIAYSNRGKAYAKLGHNQLAIKDFNEAIRLQPDYVNAYNNRSFAYLLQGNNNLGCRDAQKACALGLCTVLKWAKGKGYCR
jgi:tetratricopeptide (TPR) repeat protein